MSTTTNEKTTLYLDPLTKKFLQHKAIEENTSMSQIVNDLVEDVLDSVWMSKNIEKLRKEPTVSFDEALAEAGLTYDDLRN